MHNFSLIMGCRAKIFSLNGVNSVLLRFFYINLTHGILPVISVSCLFKTVMPSEYKILRFL